MNHLTTKDRRRFERLNRLILKRVAAVKQFWLALVEIHDGRLYAGQFDSFESYLETIPEVGRIRGYQLLNAGRVAQNVPIQTERQARVLGNLPVDLQKQIWAEGENRFGKNPNGGQLQKILTEKVAAAEKEAASELKRPALKRKPADKKEMIGLLMAKVRKLNAGLPDPGQGEAILLSYLSWLGAVLP